jgi:hypothetical protein
MWQETIATSGRRQRLAGRLVTGPAAFRLAGLIDAVLMAVLLRSKRRRGRMS